MGRPLPRRGEAGLLDRSSAPKTVANRTEERRIEAIAALRRLRMTGAEIAECWGWRSPPSRAAGRDLGTTEADWAFHLDDVREAVTASLAAMRKLNAKEIRRHRARLKSLEAKRGKFLEAFYADALPADLLKSEQDKISAEIDAAKGDLSRVEGDVTKIAATADRMLDAALNMARAYRESDGLNRRFWNQALFDCFRVCPDEEIEGELREEVRQLTAADTPRRLRAECRKPVSSSRGWNKSYLAGLMRRYANPDVKTRLDRLDI